MKKLSKYEQLEQAIGGFKESKWLLDAEQRKANKGWLKHSQKVALLVLRSIRSQGISQKELALRVDVSPQLVNKWLKGSENLTLETMVKFEDALEIQLIAIGTPIKIAAQLTPVVQDKQKYTLPAKNTDRSFKKFDSKVIPLNSKTNKVNYGY